MNTPVQWDIRSLLQWTRQHFEQKQIDTPKLDAELLLSHACQLSRLDLHLKFDQSISAQHQTKFRELVRRRALGEPVAYLIGNKEFWSLSLVVQSGVLIPRPETETLIEAALTIIKADSKTPTHVLEWGCGSAAISLALCAEREQLNIIALEVDSQALAVAKLNLEQHQNLLQPRNNTLQLLHSNGFEALRTPTTSPTLPTSPALPALPKHFDLLVANPPYLSQSELKQVSPEVAHEPSIALDGGPDGLLFYRQILEQAPAHLKPQAHVLLEIGSTQAPDLQRLVQQNSVWVWQALYTDLQQLPRVVHLCYVGGV